MEVFSIGYEKPVMCFSLFLKKKYSGTAITGILTGFLMWMKK